MNKKKEDRKSYSPKDLQNNIIKTLIIDVIYTYND